MRHGRSIKRALSISTDPCDGALGAPGLYTHSPQAAGDAQAALSVGQEEVRLSERGLDWWKFLPANRRNFLFIGMRWTAPALVRIAQGLRLSQKIRYLSLDATISSLPFQVFRKHSFIKFYGLIYFKNNFPYCPLWFAPFTLLFHSDEFAVICGELHVWK